MPLDTLENTLAHEMSDLLNAETQFAKALQQVAKAATSASVQQLAQEHHAETLQQIETLKQAFTVIGQKPERVVCKAAQGIVEENTSTLKEEKPKGALKDIALIGGSLRVEHYEIAGYSAAIAIAKALGQREVTQLLTRILKQEQATAKKLEGAALPLLQAARADAPTASSSAPTAPSSRALKATSNGVAKTGAAKKTPTVRKSSAAKKVGGTGKLRSAKK